MIPKLNMSSNTMESNLIINEDCLIPLQKDMILIPSKRMQTDERPWIGSTK
jgi:hypothetical protein